MLGLGLASVRICEGGCVGRWCAGLASAVSMCAWLSIVVRARVSLRRKEWGQKKISPMFKGHKTGSQAPSIILSLQFSDLNSVPGPRAPFNSWRLASKTDSLR